MENKIKNSVQCHKIVHLFVRVQTNVFDTLKNKLNLLCEKNFDCMKKFPKIACPLSSWLYAETMSA